MKLSKESKIRILENFYALDYVFFGKPVLESTVCCPFFIQEYLSVKGAILSVMIEMFNLVEHTPSVINEKVNTKNLQRMALFSAKSARENCKKLVVTEKGKEDVKKMIKEALNESKGSDVKMEDIVQSKIREKAYSLAVDNLLIARTISESEGYTKMNTWEGKILEDAYKILRDQLVECALNIVEN
jgi:hypothetical protein